MQGPATAPSTPIAMAHSHAATLNEGKTRSASRTHLYVLPKLPSSDSLNNSPGPASPGT